LFRFLKFALLLVAATEAVLLYSRCHQDNSRGSPTASSFSVGPNWANPASLPDHFARHGAAFGARNETDYAHMATQFLQRARSEGLPAKIDERGVIRVFDPRTHTFGAYNRDGTTKTFFRPASADYFARQPGRAVDLRGR